MPENVSFSFELIDKVSAAASRMERSLVNIERALTHTQGTARAGAGSWTMFGIRLGVVSGIASEVTRSLIDLGGQVLKMGATGAKWALEAGSFNENTQLSLEAILGSASAAQKAISTWRGLAEGTPFEARDVIDWGKQLTIAGESLENTVTIMRAAADVGTKMGASADEQKKFGQGFMGLLTNIREMGSEASLRQLRAFYQFGISPEKIEQELAGRLSGGNVAQLRKMMDYARTTGQDMSWEIVRAALQVTQNTTGTLGGLGRRGATTLSGEMERLQSRVKFDLFAGFEKTAGYRAIKGVLANLIDVLDPRSASGKAIQDGIRQISDALAKFLGPLTGPEGKKNMVSFFNDMKTAIDNALPSVMNIANALGFLAKWGIVKPVQGLSMLTDIGSDVAGMVAGTLKPGDESKTTRDVLDAAFGPRPAGMVRPSVNVTNTIHVHGNADTDNLLFKIDVSTKDALDAYFDTLGLQSGAQ